MSDHSHKERGVALLIVLLLLAMLAVVGITVTETMRLATQRSIAVSDRDQARWHMSSVEALAVNLLEVQWKARPAHDNLNEAWLEEDIVIPLERGAIVLRIEDASSCFNLNALVSEEAGMRTPNLARGAQFEKLLEALGLSGPEAAQLVAVATDWTDSDEETGRGGAEDGFYTRLSTPYRTPARRMASVSELRSMVGVSPLLYKTVAPHVCVLPDDRLPGLNVNTVTDEDLPAMMAALDTLSTDSVMQLVSQRPDSGYETLDSFFDNPAFEGEEINQRTRQRFQLWSEYLTMHAEIRYGSAYLQSKVLIKMNDTGRPSIVAREYGPF